MTFDLSKRYEAVYPGHPSVIALFIMSKYPTWEAATAKVQSGYAAALSDGDIPGAGGNVHMGMEVVKAVIEQGAEEAFKKGCQFWKDCVGPGSGNHEKAWAEGQAQAEQWYGAFIEAACQWDPVLTQHTDLNRDTPSASLSPPRPRM